MTRSLRSPLVFDREVERGACDFETVDFIVPTLRRPEHLRRCLSAIAAQAVQPARVLVGVRSDDNLSLDVIAGHQSMLKVAAVEVSGIGVVGAMNSCLKESASDFIALVDDDVELPDDWLRKMLVLLGGQPLAVAAGGRDLLMDHPEMRRTEQLVEDVGRIALSGRMTGNHHRGGGSARLVDILRGSNCLFRGGFLREVGFEKGLAGSGAQVNWELALALQAKSRGFRMLYEPAVTVIHHVAPRHDSDSVHRGVFDASGTADIAHNETLVTLRHGRGVSRVMILLWQILIGSKTCPGMARSVECFRGATSEFGRRYVATLRGRFAAVRTVVFRIEHAG